MFLRKSKKGYYELFEWVDGMSCPFCFDRPLLQANGHNGELVLVSCPRCRAGEILKEPDTREKPGEYKKLHDVTFSPKPSLEDLGITKIQSHRWQKEAEVSEGKLP